MLQWLRVRGRRITGAVLLLALGSCSGDSLVIGLERPRPADDEEDAVSLVNGAAPASEVALLLDCPPSPEERQAAPGCWPTPHLGYWRGFFVGVPRYETLDGSGAEFPTGDVLLMLGIDGVGHLVFGAPQSGPMPMAAPVLPLCDPDAPAPRCSAPGLIIPGFAYRLEQLELLDRDLGPEPRIGGEPRPTLGERLSFRVRVGEPWDAWCAEREPGRGACAGGDCTGALPAAPASSDAPAAGLDPAGCLCTATECVSAAPALWIELSMSDDGDALRGTYTPSDPTLDDARLEFVKEP